MEPLHLPQSLAVQVDPLPDEVRMFSVKRVMNVLFPKEIDPIAVTVPDVALSQVVPLSVEVTIEPVLLAITDY